MLRFRKVGLPCFGVLKNKSEEDVYDDLPTKPNDIFNFVKKSDFIIGKIGVHVIWELVL
jgi:hypothetical protein